MKAKVGVCDQTLELWNYLFESGPAPGVDNGSGWFN